MSQKGKSREEAQQQLKKGLDIILSFTAEEWEEIQHAIKEDPELRRLMEQTRSKLKAIIAMDESYSPSPNV